MSRGIPTKMTLREFIIKIMTKYPDYLEDELSFSTYVKNGDSVDSEFREISECGMGFCTIVLDQKEEEEE